MGKQIVSNSEKNMAKLVTVQDGLHDTILKLRRIEYIVDSHLFQVFWGRSTKEQQLTVIEVLEHRDLIALIKWLDTHPSLDVGELSSGQLKARARMLKIVNYSRLTKVELIRAIKECENERLQAATVSKD